MNRRTLILGASALGVAAFAGGAFVLKQRRDAEAEAAAAAAPTADPTLLVREYSPSFGPADAPVTLVEFFDPSCEACRAFYPIVKRIVNPKFRDRVCGGPATADQRLRRRPNERAGRREATANALGCRQTGWRDPSGIISAARDERDRPCLTAGVSLPPWKKRGTTGWDSP